MQYPGDGKSRIEWRVNSMLIRLNVSKQSALRVVALAAVAACVWTGCDTLVVPVEQRTDAVCAYRVFPQQENRMRVEIDIAEAGLDSFVLPPVYADNPIIDPPEGYIRRTSARDSAGRKIRMSTASANVGPLWSTIAILDIPVEALFPLTLSYEIDLSLIADSTANQTHPRQFSDGQSATILGSYAFAVPYAGDLVAMWRKPFRASIAAPENAIGASASPYIVRNACELLFSHIIAGAKKIKQGEGGGQQFAIYSFNETALDDQPIPRLEHQTAVALDSLVPLFGRLQATAYPIVCSDIGGGLEGTHGFFMRSPVEENNHATAMIIIHELLHHWIGIRCGEYDDPWWKEGVTQYLGWSYAGQWGLATVYHCHEALIDIWRDTEYADYALASPAFRAALHQNGNNALAYGRGAQLSMLLDLRVRKQTQNSVSLGDVTRYLVDRFDRDAFTRADFLDAFARFGVERIDSLLHAYADVPAAIPADTLENAFSQLKALGAFGAKTIVVD